MRIALWLIAPLLVAVCASPATRTEPAVPSRDAASVDGAEQGHGCSTFIEPPIGCMDDVPIFPELSGAQNGCTDNLFAYLSGEEFDALGPYRRRWGDDFHPACQVHDICYSDLATPKTECDSTFKESMLQVCEALGGRSSHDAMSSRAVLRSAERCRTAAHIYYGAVIKVGNKSHMNSQVEARARWEARARHLLGLETLPRREACWLEQGQCHGLKFIERCRAKQMNPLAGVTPTCR